MYRKLEVSRSWTDIVNGLLGCRENFNVPVLQIYYYDGRCLEISACCQERNPYLLGRLWEKDRRYCLHTVRKTAVSLIHSWSILVDGRENKEYRLELETADKDIERPVRLEFPKSKSAGAFLSVPEAINDSQVALSIRIAECRLKESGCQEYLQGNSPEKPLMEAVCREQGWTYKDMSKDICIVFS